MSQAQLICPPTGVVSWSGIMEDEEPLRDPEATAPTGPTEGDGRQQSTLTDGLNPIDMGNIQAQQLPMFDFGEPLFDENDPVGLFSFKNKDQLTPFHMHRKQNKAGENIFLLFSVHVERG